MNEQGQEKVDDEKNLPFYCSPMMNFAEHLYILETLFNYKSDYLSKISRENAKYRIRLRGLNRNECASDKRLGQNYSETLGLLVFSLFIANRMNNEENDS
jgi:hypothetical protein